MINFVNYLENNPNVSECDINKSLFLIQLFKILFCLFFLTITSSIITNIYFNTYSFPYKASLILFSFFVLFICYIVDSFCFDLKTIKFKEFLIFYLKHNINGKLRCQYFNIRDLIKNDLGKNILLLLKIKNNNFRTIAIYELFNLDNIDGELFNNLYNLGVYNNLVINTEEEKQIQDKLRKYRDNKMKSLLCDF
jgi:hypothetical protein